VKSYQCTEQNMMPINLNQKYQWKVTTISGRVVVDDNTLYVRTPKEIINLQTKLKRNIKILGNEIHSIGKKHLRKSKQEYYIFKKMS
jgi:hypothetical protein